MGSIFKSDNEGTSTETEQTENTTPTKQRDVNDSVFTELKAIGIAKQESNNPTMPEGFQLDKSFGKDGYINGESGAQVAAFINEKTGERMIAVAGTNQFINMPSMDDINPVGKDIRNYPNVGRDQWKEIAPEVKRYINTLPEDAKVNLVGHSLGGGVVQHGMHDLKNPDGDFAGLQIKGSTYDAPGAASSIESYDPKRVPEGSMTNYVVKDSAVSKLGGKHVGGNVFAVEPASNTTGDFKLPGFGESNKKPADHKIRDMAQSFSYHKKENKPLNSYKPAYWDVPEVIGNAGDGLNNISKIMQHTPTGQLIKVGTKLGGTLKDKFNNTQPAQPRNKLDSKMNGFIDQGKALSDKLSFNIMPNERMEDMTSAQTKTWQQMAEAMRRVMLETNITGDTTKIIKERPDAITDKKLHPQQDTDNDILFKDMGKRVRDELAGLQNKGNKADQGEIIQRVVQENFGKIKFTSNTDNPITDLFESPNIGKNNMLEKPTLDNKTQNPFDVFKSKKKFF